MPLYATAGGVKIWKNVFLTNNYLDYCLNIGSVYLTMTWFSCFIWFWTRKWRKPQIKVFQNLNIHVGLHREKSVIHAFIFELKLQIQDLRLTIQLILTAVPMSTWRPWEDSYLFQMWKRSLKPIQVFKRSPWPYHKNKIGMKAWNIIFNHNILVYSMYADFWDMF